MKSEYLQALITYRLQRAAETLEEAHLERLCQPSLLCSLLCSVS